MKKISKIIQAILIIVSYLVIYSGIGKLFKHFSLVKSDQYILQIIAYIIMTIFLLVILTLIKKKNILKFEKKSFFKTFLIGGFVSFLIIFAFISGVKTGIDSGNKILPLYKIIPFCISIIVGTGFTEELLCRGIVQNLMFDAFGKKTKKGICLSIIISSLLFGSAHFINYFTIKASFEGVLTQVIVATVIGLYFGAIYARCKNIWGVALIHGLFDFVQMMDEGIWGIGSATATISSYKLSTVTFPIMLYTFLFIFLLRKEKIKECMEK